VLQGSCEEETHPIKDVSKKQAECIICKRFVCGILSACVWRLVMADYWYCVCVCVVRSRLVLPFIIACVCGIVCVSVLVVEAIVLALLLLLLILLLVLCGVYGGCGEIGREDRQNGLTEMRAGNSQKRG
jgi:hypothetical protein